METLRIYLVLPLYHEFLNSKNYPKLHSPFCKTVLGLEMIPLKIVSGWFAKTSTEYFERLVEIFKDVIRYYLHFEIAKICHPASKQVIYEQNFFICLNMLSLLYHINHQQREKSHKVPYELFHISEIADYFEIRQDYVQWCIDMNVSNFRMYMYCSYITLSFVCLCSQIASICVIIHLYLMRQQRCHCYKQIKPFKCTMPCRMLPINQY